MDSVKTRIIKARFHVVEFTPQRMLEISKPVFDHIKSRIQQGQNVRDANAMPLSMKYRERYDKTGRLIRLGADRGYRAWKAKRFPPAIRNWRLTGFTLGRMGVLAVGAFRATIGFAEAIRPAMTITGKTGRVFYLARAISVNTIVSRLQIIEPMFGLSPSDREVFINQVFSKPIIAQRRAA